MRVTSPTRSPLPTSRPGAQAACGPIDVLINAAGWGRTAPFVEGTPEFWDNSWR